jgi:hypothetical protein
VGHFPQWKKNTRGSSVVAPPTRGRQQKKSPRQSRIKKQLTAGGRRNDDGQGENTIRRTASLFYSPIHHLRNSPLPQDLRFESASRLCILSLSLPVPFDGRKRIYASRPLPCCWLPPPNIGPRPAVRGLNSRPKRPTEKKIRNLLGDADSTTAGRRPTSTPPQSRWCRPPSRRRPPATWRPAATTTRCGRVRTGTRTRS